MATPIRVRFAPSPTGFMHLGNVRAIILNYLFAQQKNGTFILRIEDTDMNRNLEEAKVRIVEDMKWLSIRYNEGPLVGGKYGPYFQSERTEIYNQQLMVLIEQRKVYRCFCTMEILEEKRKKQIEAKKAPRYDRVCRTLSDDKIKAKLAASLPFIWRFGLNDDQIFEINDLAKGKVTFDMKHYSDFALTRPDGTVTFVFANFVDDWFMKISHVVRGEDHLSNTGMQAALYDAFAVIFPTFWHLPLICNQQGEKLSKRDFGFSLEDLKAAGFLPEAILNYLATIGASFAEEIQSKEELVKSFKFDHLHSASTIRYDLEKLAWFNQKWITRLSLDDLLKHLLPVLYAAHPEAKTLAHDRLVALITLVKPNLKTLLDIGPALAFYFKEPVVDRVAMDEKIGAEKIPTILDLIREHVEKLSQSPDAFLEALKAEAQQKNIKTKELFGSLRYLLTGSFEGLGMHDLFAMLELEVLKKRLTQKL